MRTHGSTYRVAIARDFQLSKCLMLRYHTAAFSYMFISEGKADFDAAEESQRIKVMGGTVRESPQSPHGVYFSLLHTRHSASVPSETLNSFLSFAIVHCQDGTFKCSSCWLAAAPEQLPFWNLHGTSSSMMAYNARHFSPTTKLKTARAICVPLRR